MAMIRRYSPSALSKLARGIVDKGEDGVKLRRDLVSATQDNELFVSFVEDKMRELADGIFEGNEEPQTLCDRMTESEYNSLPPGTMRKMADAWSNLEKRDASEPAVWAYINVRLIKDGLIDASYFAAGENGREDSKGIRQLDRALRDNSGRLVVDRARQIIRNWSGASEIRGIREMYQNCSPARAWWTCKLADEAAAEDPTSIDITEQKAIKVLREKSVWNRLSERIVSQLTVIGDIKIRNGIILFLIRQKEGGSTRFIQDETLKMLFQRIGQMSSWRALGFFESSRVCDIISEEIVPFIGSRTES